MHMTRADAFTRKFCALLLTGSYSSVVKSGLTRAEGRDGLFMWVHEDAVADFERGGRESLLEEVREMLEKFGYSAA